MRVAHVSGTVRSDGPQLRLAKAGIQIEKLSVEHRPRDIGKTASVINAPDFVAAGRVVGDEPLSARDDDLVAALDVNNQGRGERLFSVGVALANRPPFLFPDWIA